jgi:DUF1009 family protein
MSEPPRRAPLPGVVGLLAGGGLYPRLLAERLVRAQRHVIAAGIRRQTAPSLAKAVDRFEVFGLGAIKRTALYFKGHGVEHIYLAGGIRRPLAWQTLRPDRIALELLMRHRRSGDDALLRGVADAFLSLGLAVADPSPFIEDFLAGEGHLAGPPIAPSALADLDVAWKAAKALGRRDRGQSATALCKKVTGLETKAGTDVLIASAPGPGAVLAKVVKPGQDLRFDRPAIGPATVARAHGASISAIAIEARGVLLLERDRLLDACERHRITLVGFSASGPNAFQ